MAAAFTQEFFGNEDKKKQWTAFCEKNESYVEEATLQQVLAEIEPFLAPVLEDPTNNTTFARKWTRKTGWL